MSNLTSIDGAGQVDKSAEALRDLEKNMANVLKAQALFAQITFAKYQAFIAAGFTDKQALDLCKNG